MNNYENALRIWALFFILTLLVLCFSFFWLILGKEMIVSILILLGGFFIILLSLAGINRLASELYDYVRGSVRN